MLPLIKNFFLDIFFPPACLSCNQHLAKEEKYGLICGSCFVSIPLYSALFCPVCLNRIPPEADHCHRHRDGNYVLAAATNYNDPRLQTLLLQMKYQSWLTASQPLGDLLTAYCHGIFKYLNISGSPWLVTPVPLYKNRELKRGFNQAGLLASIISRRFYLELNKDNLVRIKDTKPQAELKDYTAREKNLEGAFGLRHPPAFKNKNIILVDDVFTSGATLNEAARVLKSAGAKKILALVLARAR